VENTKDLRRLHQHPASAWAPYGVALAAFLVSFLLRQALEQAARFVVRDANGQQLGYFYFEEEPDGRQAAHERRGAADRGQLAKLPVLIRKT